MPSAICSIMCLDDEKEEKLLSTARSNIMLQIAVAMNYLHESGVMHCDLKATNGLVNVLEDHDGYFVICAS
jgi:serine/threonine protein kinase